MIGEPSPAPSVDGESSWPAWPRGRASDRSQANPVGRVFLLFVVAIGVWLLVRLV